MSEAPDGGEIGIEIAVTNGTPAGDQIGIEAVAATKLSVS